MLPAEENKIPSALPMRFSDLTKPTPPAVLPKRLSNELSRLSPTKKKLSFGTFSDVILSPYSLSAISRTFTFKPSKIYSWYCLFLH